MARLNPRTLPLLKLNQLQKDLWKVITSLETPEEVEDFFVDLLTHTERKMLAKRFRIAVMLLAGESYVKIMEELAVGDGVVSSVHNLLKTGATAMEAAATRLVKEDRRVTLSDDWEPPRIGHYRAGDLLSPVVDETARLIKRKIREKKRGY